MLLVSLRSIDTSLFLSLHEWADHIFAILYSSLIFSRKYIDKCFPAERLETLRAICQYEYVQLCWLCVHEGNLLVCVSLKGV